MMRIELVDPGIEKTVDRILSGELPPATGDKEVLQAIAQRVADGQASVEWFRREGDREIVYSSSQVATFADRWPEPRPIGCIQVDSN